EHARSQSEWERQLSEQDRTIQEQQKENERLCETLASFEKGAFEEADRCMQLQEELDQVREERDRVSRPDPALLERLEQTEQALLERDQQLAVAREQLASQASDRNDRVHLLEIDLKSAHAELGRVTADAAQLAA